MDEATPHIDVRAVQLTDAPALLALDDSFETDRIYLLRVHNWSVQGKDASEGSSTFSLELVETPVDPPLYKDHSEQEQTQEEIEGLLQQAEGGYVALADGNIAGVILLRMDEVHLVARIEAIIVGHQFRRYGIGTLLLHCASDWARKRGCWAITLETQNTNYPAVQFYLSNGLEVWSIQRHCYPPGPTAHEVALIMGKRLSTTAL